MSQSPPFADIMARHLSRRDFMRHTMRAGAGLAAMGMLPAMAYARVAKESAALSSLHFKEISKALTPTHQIAPGYATQIIARWGDRISPFAPIFDPQHQTREAQEKQFGYNNDFIAYLPFPHGSDHSDHGLLCVNHEFTDAALMFPDISRANASDEVCAEQMHIEQAAHGLSIIELERLNGVWHTVLGSPFNRRITATSDIRISGPAAGNDRLKTKLDPTGKLVKGTVANCAGGTTPWGTALTCEENFNLYFSTPPDNAPELAAQTRYKIGKKSPYAKFFYSWYRHEERFDVAKEPNECNRFGWVVEYDPYDPSFTPVKRTALGRFMHESASCALTADGRVAVYSGDDQTFEYLYRFVTRDRYSPNDRSKNRDLLDHGTLYAARFLDDGTLRWLPLVHGTGPLIAKNGFHSQADVVIEARRAADLMGATPMDRPEDVEVNPTSGKVYMALTKNPERTAKQIDAANPRANNQFGHILEITPPSHARKTDHGAADYRWDIFLLGGDPANKESGAMYHGAISTEGWLSKPDNVAFDAKGRIWIATDGQQDTIGVSDSLYAADTTGAGYGITRLFFNAPRGSEVSGPAFTPDGTTLFLSISHPGDEKTSTFNTPSTRWPDFNPNTPPRPSVIAIVRNDGGVIGDT